uniref:Tc1-like transposase DDE domain-containing protein n=1 Tax=Caenorhabditis japonica TaxID=281687 RepID=A0A8R1E7E6_CAEJA
MGCNTSTQSKVSDVGAATAAIAKPRTPSPPAAENGVTTEVPEKQESVPVSVAPVTLQVPEIRASRSASPASTKSEPSYSHIRLLLLGLRRRLQVAGLHGRRPVKKPLVSLKNWKARVEWAKQHLSWGPREWANHIWSDESKFNLFGTDSIQWIRRPIGSRYAPQYQCPTVKHGGGSVMVWGCFCDTSMGPLKKIVKTMDRYVYKDILENTMRPWVRANLGRSWVFQQDNDPKHTSSHVANWFRRRRVDLLEWPRQSPDLNPIEHMWEELERRLKGVRASNANQKFAQLEAAWKSIPMTVVQTLLDSMSRRCQAVIDAKGYPTKY